MNREKNQTNLMLLKNRIFELLKEDGAEKVSIIKAEKNNGVTLYGIQIRVFDSMIAPVYYPPTELLYDEKGIERVAHEIAEQFRTISFQVTDQKFEFSDYESLKDKLRIGIMNRSMNERKLTGVPYKEFLDLAEVAILEIEIAGEYGGVLVNEDLLSSWNISVDDMFFEARINSYTYEPVHVEKLDEIVEKMRQEGVESEVNVGTPFLYLSNNRGRRGASAILYPDIADQILDHTKGESFYIIPSSVCELLVLPESVVDDRDHLKQMIEDVNSTVLDRQDILSDNLYYYDVQKMQYEIVP